MNSPIQLTNKEIYNRVASNIELISLYSSINEKIILDGTNNPTRLFRTVTNLLKEIKQTLDQIQVKMTFQHQWFAFGKFISFWAYYNKVSIENDNPAEQQNIRRFYARQVIPMIPMTDGNRANIERLN